MFNSNYRHKAHFTGDATGQIQPLDWKSEILGAPCRGFCFLLRRFFTGYLGVRLCPFNFPRPFLPCPRRVTVADLDYSNRDGNALPS